jgi:hypothetical protein
MKPIKKLLGIMSITIVGFFTIGCSGTPVYIKTAEPKLYENTKNKGRQISASASGFQLLLFIPIDINDRQQRAYELLKAQAGNGYITDVKIKESWTYAFVGTSYKTTFTATVYPKE